MIRRAGPRFRTSRTRWTRLTRSCGRRPILPPEKRQARRRAPRLWSSTPIARCGLGVQAAASCRVEQDPALCSKGGVCSAPDIQSRRVLVHRPQMGQAQVSRKRGCAEAQNCASAPLELGTSAPLPVPELERRHSGFLCSSECFCCWTNRGADAFVRSHPFSRKADALPPTTRMSRLGFKNYLHVLASDSSSLLLLPWDFF